MGRKRFVSIALAETVQTLSTRENDSKNLIKHLSPVIMMTVMDYEAIGTICEVCVSVCVCVCVCVCECTHLVRLIFQSGMQIDTQPITALSFQLFVQSVTLIDCASCQLPAVHRVGVGVAVTHPGACEVNAKVKSVSRQNTKICAHSIIQDTNIFHYCRLTVIGFPQMP